jgi:predicted methyltransferase
VGADTLTPWLKTIHIALKPTGVLGIVQHRAPEGVDPKEWAKKGYVPEAWLIEQIEAQGFELSEKSEINANPKDTKDYADGVWTLPPNLRQGETNRQKYIDIGESDRMTLRFKKKTSAK